jgi:hypothetical protein
MELWGMELTRLGLAFALGLTTAACGSDLGSTEDYNTARGVARLADVVTVLPDRLVIPTSSVSDELRTKIDAFEAAVAGGALPDSVENVILLDSRSSHAGDRWIDEESGNPYGFIRRALSLREEGEDTVIFTEQATIVEALEELAENGYVEMGGADLTQQSRGGPTTFERTYATQWDGNTELYENGNLVVRVGDTSVSLDFTVISELDLGLRGIDKAELTVQVDAASKLSLEVAVENGDTNVLDHDFDYELFSGKYVLGTLGPVPITGDLSLNLHCTAQAGAGLSVTTGLESEARITTHLLYESAELSAALDAQPPTFTVVPPSVTASASASVRCALEPRVDILMFDVVGPYVAPYAYAQADLSVPPPTAELKVGLGANLGGSLQVLGENIASFDRNVAETEETLWTGTF